MGRVHEVHEISRFRRHFFCSLGHQPCVELHQIDHQPISHGACIGGIALHPEQHCSDEWGNLVERAD